MNQGARRDFDIRVNKWLGVVVFLSTKYFSISRSWRFRNLDLTMSDYLICLWILFFDPVLHIELKFLDLLKEASQIKKRTQ